MENFEARPADEVRRIKEAIRFILEGNPKLNQIEVVEKLKGMDFYTSQPTVSRYIKEMNYSRDSKEGYIKKEEVLVKEKKEVLLDYLNNSDRVRRIRHVKMIAFKTAPGEAQILEMHLQEAYREQILGTVLERESLVVFIEDNEVGLEMLRSIGMHD
ncbi:hypothetical protein PAAL109150_16305 [Paenibacillus alkaliterrae]